MKMHPPYRRQDRHRRDCEKPERVRPEENSRKKRNGLQDRDRAAVGMEVRIRRGYSGGEFEEGDSCECRRSDGEIHRRAHIWIGKTNFKEAD